MSATDPIVNNERITRYINEQGKIRPSTGKAGYNAFMPPKNLRLSIYRTETLGDGEVWAIADEFVSTAEKPVIARADLPASSYLSKALTIEPDGVPHPRHSNAVGWLTDHSAQKVIALQLAESAALFMK